jgi:soluble lytic murein transglycosylase
LFGFILQFTAGVALAKTAPAAAELSGERRGYETAVRAIDTGSWTEYEQLRPGLDAYPLAIYLDYFQLTGQADRVRPADARQFIIRSEGSPLPNRFKAVYLRRAGKDRRWRDFLQVNPDEPNSIELKCYYFRARLAAGDQEAAWEGARRLWDFGKSRHKACDPLFSAWLEADQLSDEIVWARLLKAFESRQRSLLTYVAKKGSSELKPWSDKLLAVYRKPDKIQSQALPADSPYSADIASQGLSLLARYDAEQALRLWAVYQDRLDFTPEQTRQVEYAIALRGLFGKHDAMLPWIQGAIARLGDDKLVEIRLRWALAEQDWAALAETLPSLSAEQREEGSWQYWQARLWQQQGEVKQANAALAKLAGERSYYGFLAADLLGQAYAFNPKPPAESEPGEAPLQQLPAVLRIEELNFHEEYNLAHSEWFTMLRGSDDPTRHEQLAVLAAQQGWYRMAIDAAARAKAWDALDLRFPLPYQNTFERYASAQKVPSSELMAIARRESAFYPQARSPVGARGLMQIMPATGKQVASSIGQSHRGADLYEVEHNVRLGSAYYRQLLDRFDGNRVFALTAYNAGPHRVDRWRNEPGEGVSVEIWVETIPFRETRHYVQAVLSYNLVFQYLMGDTSSLLSPLERQAEY